ncbi:MAG: hypothetical protein E6K18_07710 [Methanobacteriota archaeon]|nr:MAG: hypothetical protein E6K18_07710 [Euryarchaeota archaeon]
MGRMYVDIEIGRGLDGPFETLVMELDTGSDDTGLPRPFLRSLGVRPLGWDRYELADGRRVRRQYGIAFLRLRGEVGATRVMFCGPRDAPVLGVIALEELGFIMDVRRGGLRKFQRQMI